MIVICGRLLVLFRLLSLLVLVCNFEIFYDYEVLSMEAFWRQTFLLCLCSRWISESKSLRIPVFMMIALLCVVE